MKRKTLIISRQKKVILLFHKPGKSTYEQVQIQMEVSVICRFKIFNENDK